MRSIAFTLAVLLMAVPTWAAETTPQVLVFISGRSADSVPLEIGQSQDLNAYHPGWMPEGQKSLMVALSSKTLDGADQRFSASFTPQAAGKIRLILTGNPQKEPDENGHLAYTRYDNLRLQGADLSNGDFEVLDQHGEFEGWQSQNGAIVHRGATGQLAQVWAGNELSQEIEVTAGQTLTLSFEATGLVAPPQNAASNQRSGRNDAGQSMSSDRAAHTGPTPEAKSNEGMFPPKWEMLDTDAEVPEKAEEDQLQTEDYTDTLRQRLARGETDIQIPDGNYRISEPVTIPEGTSVHGSGNTVLLLAPEAAEFETLLTLDGDRITLRDIDLRMSDKLLDQVIEVRKAPIHGSGIREVAIRRVKFSLTDRQYVIARTSRERPSTARHNMPVRWPLILLDQCKDVEMSGCTFRNFSVALNTTHCTRVKAYDNKAVNGLHNLLRFYHGSEFMWYKNNWVSHVKHPVVWDGGDAASNASHKVNKPEEVWPGVSPDDPTYASNMSGTYNVICSGNYGEYGKTLIWGRKGRRILVTGNEARYITDLAYDAEGCREVVFSNNIAINCKAGGVGLFYSNNSSVVTGNLFAVYDIGAEIYKGDFLRVHGNRELRAHNTLIANNVFVNHLDEIRFLHIDKGYNLVVRGNSFVNGGIFTNPYGDGEIVVEGNTFESTLKGQGALVRVERAVGEFTFINNTMVNRNGVWNDGDMAIDVSLGVKESGDERVATAANDVYRLIKDNNFRGWKQPIQFTDLPKVGSDGQFIVVGNVFDGEVSAPQQLRNGLVQDSVSIQQRDLSQ